MKGFVVYRYARNNAISEGIYFGNLVEIPVFERVKSSCNSLRYARDKHAARDQICQISALYYFRRESIIGDDVYHNHQSTRK